MMNSSLLQRLREEKDICLSGGIYQELQVRLTYHSSRIEGGRLSEEQTRLIFEISTVLAPEGVPVDDVIETVNHFHAVDYVIDHAEDPLTEKIIKKLQGILKQSTKDSTRPWFAVGDFKRLPNVVGNSETARPEDVPALMAALLSRYESLPTVTIEDIISFHWEFEHIHPFQDGNSRVGRLIALKECLRHGIVPFIIEDPRKAFYYRGLSQWNQEKGYLIDTCLDGQDTFKKLMDFFKI